MRPAKPSRALLVLACVVTCSALPGAAALWHHAGQRALATSLFLLGLSMGPCLGAYAVVPRARKQAARRVTLFAGGLSLVAFSVLGATNLDLEGFFMLLFMGTMGAAVGHTLVTAVLGPVFFGRFLCGWGCWRSMVLELLPIGRSPGRLGGRWNSLPLAGLTASASCAALFVFLSHYHPGGAPGRLRASSLAPIAASFAIYYVASIGLAFALKDQRAFCKYLCPNSVILGITSRLSLLKMTSDRQLCNNCGACSRICPMDIDVAGFAIAGGRDKSGQCILCQRCAHACPTGALRLSAGFDTAGRTPLVRRAS